MSSKKESADAECCTIHAPIDRLGHPGRWLRKTMLEWSLRGMPLLLAVQKRRTAGWTKFFQVARHLGEEDFFTVAICFVAWVVDQNLAFLSGILMCLCFYCTNLLKNAFRLPRPALPPVNSLESAHDWSFPSLHSVTAVALPWYVYFYSLDTFNMQPRAVLIFFLTCSVWSLTIVFDRIYLGVHSPADVVAGGLLGVCLLAVYRFFHLDMFVEHFVVNSMSPVLYSIPLLTIFLVALHPESGYPSLTRSESTCLLGIAQGFMFAKWPVTRMLAPFPALLEQGSPDYSGITLASCMFLRLLVGMLCLLLVRICLKTVLRPLCKALLETAGLRTFVSSKLAGTTVTAYNRKTYRLPDQFGDVKLVKFDTSDDPLPDALSHRPYPPDFTDVHFDSDIPMRIVVYTAMGWTALQGLPYLFHQLGI